MRGDMHASMVAACQHRPMLEALTALSYLNCTLHARSKLHHAQVLGYELTNVGMLL